MRSKGSKSYFHYGKCRQMKPMATNSRLLRFFAHDHIAPYSFFSFFYWLFYSLDHRRCTGEMYWLCGRVSSKRHKAFFFSDSVTCKLLVGLRDHRNCFPFKSSDVIEFCPCTCKLATFADYTFRPAVCHSNLPLWTPGRPTLTWVWKAHDKVNLKVREN